MKTPPFQWTFTREDLAKLDPSRKCVTVIPAVHRHQRHAAGLEWGERCCRRGTSHFARCSRMVRWNAEAIWDGELGNGSA